MFVMVVIIYSIYKVPKTVTDMVIKMGSQSVWAKAKHEKPSKDPDVNPHVLLIGEISDSSLVNFL